jgi:hypothetical protein
MIDGKSVDGLAAITLVVSLINQLHKKGIMYWLCLQFSCVHHQSNFQKMALCADALSRNAEFS